MPIRKQLNHKRLIVDIGCGFGEFVSLLKKRHPNSKVIGIDRLNGAKARVKMSMGEFATKLKDPSRIQGIWINHVDTNTNKGFLEFTKLIQIVPTQTPIFLTIRKSNINNFRKTIEKVSKQHKIKIKSEIPFNPKTMIGSEFTKKFYDDFLKNNMEERRPYRIVLMKE